MGVASNLARIRDAIGKNPVKLIAVAKSASLTQIEEAFENGVTEFGENRIQDAIDRRAQLPEKISSQCNWHFIGHLQTNKAKRAVGYFKLIHSVDSLKLAQEISFQSSKKNVVQGCLLQVKIMPDDTKSGFTPQTLKKEMDELLTLSNLELQGLMTISPLSNDRTTWFECFNGLRNLRDELEQEHSIQLKELSMGMSTDYPEAIESGATMIRLGSAIFKV